MKRTFNVDFRELKDREKEGYGFQSLIKQIGITLGYYKINPGGTGADAGKDLVFTITDRNMYGKTTERRWLVSCKDNSKSNKSVSVTDINKSGSIKDRSNQHECGGFLLACTTMPTNDATTLLEKLEDRTLVTHVWDGDTIKQILQENEEQLLYTLVRFFPNSYASTIPLLSRMIENVIEIIEEEPGNISFYDITDLVGRVEDLSCNTNSSEIKQRLSEAVLYRLLSTEDTIDCLHMLMNEWLSFADSPRQQFMDALELYLNDVCIPQLNLGGGEWRAQGNSNFRLTKSKNTYKLLVKIADSKTEKKRNLELDITENSFSCNVH